MTNFRALCAELADAYLRLLEHINNSTWLGYEPSDDPLLQRARAALAEPEPEGPTDEEMAPMFSERCIILGPHQEKVLLEGDFYAAARAVLARWGNHRGILGSSPQPPSGEVVELVAWLRERCQLMSDRPGSEFHLFTRAADLLEQLSPPQPIPVSERLPGAGDCDAEGRCWWFTPTQSWPCLYLMKRGSTLALQVSTHWLPFNALPLPSGEVSE